MKLALLATLLLVPAPARGEPDQEADKPAATDDQGGDAAKPDEQAPEPPKRHKKHRKKRHKKKSEPISVDVATESQAYYEWLWDVDKTATVMDRPVLQQRATATIGGPLPLTVVGAYRIRGSAAKDYPNGSYHVEARALYAEKAGDLYKVTVGLQEVSWGEAFGLPIVDIVNPYDLTQYQLAERADQKIPVAMVNAQLTLGAFSLQAIYTPEPRRSPTPETFDGLTVAKPPDYVAGRDAEYGARLGYLTSGGLDLKPFHFEHWNRLPVYELRLPAAAAAAPAASPPGTASPGPLSPGAAAPAAGESLALYEQRVSSTGMSFSKAFDAVVIRGDMIINDEVPVPAATPTDPPLVTRQSQAVLGGDYTSKSGKVTVGLQAQGESFGVDSAYAPRGPLYWGAVNLQAHVLSDRLTPTLMGWRGVGNADSWAEARLALDIAGGLSLEAQYDGVYSHGDGDRVYFQPQRRWYSRLTYQF